MKTSRRIARATSKAQREFRHYCSGYRRAAREQGVNPAERFTWLRTPQHGRSVVGQGLLTWTKERNPVDAHDAALRVLGQWAPGLHIDMLAARAELQRMFAAGGKRAPYFRVRHFR